MTKHTVASFFGGVGGIDLGLELTGKFKSVYINEFDKNAQKTIALNFREARLDKRDICLVDGVDVPETDLIVGGFPCQAFSIAGKKEGFDDPRGNLFFEMLRIIAARRPQAVLLENVKNLVVHDDGYTFQVIRDSLVMQGYYIKWKVMNAKDYGNIPQSRERIYIACFDTKSAWEAFTFPEEVTRTTQLADVIDFHVPQEPKYYYTESCPFYTKLTEGVHGQNSVFQWRRQYVRENKSGVVPTLTANMGTGGHNVPIIRADDGIRKLTPRETFNVQGFQASFQLPDIAMGQLYKQAGNSVAVPVITRIGEQLAKAMKARETVPIGTEDKSISIIVNQIGPYEGESYSE